MDHDIPIHVDLGLEMARRTGRHAAEVLSMVEPYVVPGVGRTVVTKDKSLSAQWVHMVAATPSRYAVLTP